MALSKFKKMLVDDDYDDDHEEETKEIKTKGKAVTPANISGKMILLEPRAFSESQQIADYLKGRNAVVVNLKRVTPDQAKRIVDFLSGTLYAIGGGLEKLGGGVFLCTPNNVNVEGKISDEKDATAKNSKKAKEDEEDEFNW